MYLAPRFGLKLKAEGADPGGGFHGANYRFRAEPGLAKASQGKTAILAGKRHSPPPARQPPHPAPPAEPPIAAPQQTREEIAEMNAFIDSVLDEMP